MNVHPSLLCLDRPRLLHVVHSVSQSAMYGFMQYANKFVCNLLHVNEDRVRDETTYCSPESR